MDTRQAPWRDLSRLSNLASFFRGAQQGQTACPHPSTPPRVAARAGRQRGPRGGRKHGWRYHRDVVRVEPSLEAAYGTLEREIDDGNESAVGNLPWWTPLVGSHAFLRDGLVHLTTRWNGARSYCGQDAVPYGVRLHSTDALRAYEQMLVELRLDVSCLQCIAGDMRLGDWDLWQEDAW